MIIKESHSAQMHREAKERERGLPSQALLDTSDPRLRDRPQVEDRTDLLANLVDRFAAALLEKLRAAEKKYGYDDAWTRPDWHDDLIVHLHKHIAKGDPRDVAAYCAFAWHHGWSLATPANSRAEAIGVKPLEWKAVRKAVIGADGYEITDMSAGNKQGWRGSFPGENTYRWFSTIEDAQDAAQGHYLRALLQREGE